MEERKRKRKNNHNNTISTNLFGFFTQIVSSAYCYVVLMRGTSPRLPIALPILYTSSKAISVGIKPTATNIAASPGFIT
jgi:hypothetical protein